MRELLRIIEHLTDILGRLGARHAFGGAIANNYWGIVRTTQDVDCLVQVAAIDYQRLADELASAGFVMRNQSGTDETISVAAMREQERARKLIELFLQGIKTELFVPFLPLQDEILRRAVRMPFGSKSILVTTAEDLILLKMTFHREKDLIDVRGILWVQRGKLDLPYLRHWSDQMLPDEVQRELDALVLQYQEPN